MLRSEAYFLIWLNNFYRLWYKWLDKRFVGTASRIVMKKVILDQFLLGPPCLLLFFVVLNTLEGRSDVMDECRKKFLATFALDCCFWIPVQMANFFLVSPTFRVPVLGIASFVWVNVLCVIKNIDAYLITNSEEEEFAKEDGK